MDLRTSDKELQLPQGEKMVRRWSGAYRPCQMKLILSCKPDKDIHSFFNDSCLSLSTWLLSPLGMKFEPPMTNTVITTE